MGLPLACCGDGNNFGAQRLQLGEHDILIGLQLGLVELDKQIARREPWSRC
ncbi:hypothetical protein N2599_31885 (plasmid) [Rhizobium sullae]|uniref:Uncharacterized protein n=1 Tax=Rhizobium sullae TaxID=50338 RepID=A0ABY5XTR5_RHISU|nr:hypothetical protein [Rhizobium sullae]UWU17352.1 hypothetical protein N2599_31885 [Rhizobium sullae]